MKNLFFSQSILRKHVSLLLLVGLIPIVAMYFALDGVVGKELKKQSYVNLEAIRLVKKQSIERYFTEAQEQLLNMAESSHTIDAMNAFTKSYRSLTAESNISDEEIDQFKLGISTYYNEDFLTEFRKYNEKDIEVNSLVKSLPNSAIVAQYEYIRSNENSIEGKQLLNNVEGNTSYHYYHQRFHKDFHNTLKRFNYDDVFLVDSKNGNVVYSTAKKIDYATSLLNGPYSGTNLSSAFRSALNLREGAFSIKDFSSYLPSYNSPVSFLASPIYEKGTLIGVLIFQISLDAVDQILKSKEGISAEVNSYLATKDNLILAGDRSEEFKSTFNDLQSRFIKNSAINRAFEDETSSAIIIDGNGDSILSAFTQISVGDVEWALISEMSSAEAFKATSIVESTLLRISLITVAFVIIFAFVVGRVLTTPVLRLAKAIRLAGESGDYKLGAEGFTKEDYSRDELGEASYAFASLLNRLSKVMSDTNEILSNAAKGDFSGSIVEEYSGQLGKLTSAINNAVGDIKADKDEQERQSLIAKENERKAKEIADQAQAQAREITIIKKALDSSNSSTMIADDDYKLLYTNSSLDKLMNEAESDIRAVLPNFTADELVGKNIDIFHISPSHQRAILDRLTETYTTDLIIGQRIMQIKATPIIENNIRIGTVVVWTDRTLELSIEKDVDNLIKSAAYGDFSNRLSLDGKNGFFLSISQGLNLLLETTNVAVDDIKRVFSALASGDLTQRIDRDYQGGFAQLKEDANNTIDKLKEVIGDIDMSANSITQSAKEISIGNGELNSRTENQAFALEKTANSMDEMTQIVRSNEEKAKLANQLANKTSASALEGNVSVQRTIQAMDAITHASNKIANIIGVIDEIAFQTNLLALNAAVEAARAGEQGRGFAVVASEVRNLAQRSASAAKEIKDLITDSVAKVNDGSALVEKSGDTLKSIVSEISQVASMIEQITTSAVKQTTGIEQVNTAVSQMDQMTQQNATLVEQAAAASQSMSDQAQDMGRLITFFKKS